MKPEQFQLIAMAVAPVATLIVVILGVFASNRHVDVRISDLQQFMEVRFTDMTRGMDQRFADSKETLRAEMRTNQSELLAKFAELDTRLTRIENERRIVQ
jgi:hypothetical protein